MHSSQLTGWLAAAPTRALTGARVLIIGGGQTLAHLALLALRHRASRGACGAAAAHCKPYDVDLEAVGDRRSKVLCRFWKLAGPAERLAFMAKAGGGSMNEEVLHELMAFARAKTAMGGMTTGGTAAAAAATIVAGGLSSWRRWR